MPGDTVPTLLPAVPLPPGGVCTPGRAFGTTTPLADPVAGVYAWPSIPREVLRGAQATTVIDNVTTAVRVRSTFKYILLLNCKFSIKSRRVSEKVERFTCFGSS